MRKPILLFLSLIIACSLTGCGNNSEKDILQQTETEMTFSEFQWPDTEIAKLMPVPRSNIGKIDWSKDYGFVLYVANTTQDDFNAYADECEKLGFTEQLQRGDTYFIANNADDYHVSLRLDDGNIMFVRIDEPKEEVTSEQEQEVIEETPEETEPPEETLEQDKTDISEESEETVPPAEKPETPTDPFSNSRHETKARMAFENYGEYICPYGIKYHWFSNPITEYEGDGIWYFKVRVTITNQYDAERDAVAEGRVDFNEETVSEFDILQSWD